MARDEPVFMGIIASLFFICSSQISRNVVVTIVIASFIIPVSQIAPFISSASQATCTELRPYITKGNLTCFACPPGFYLYGHCTTNNTIAVCRVCPQGYYSGVSGVHTRCERCSPYCESDNLIEVSNCSSTTNLTCDCPPGKVLKDPHDKHRAICLDETTKKGNASIYNQTKADPDSDDFNIVKEDINATKEDVKTLKENVRAMNDNVGRLKEDVGAVKEDVGRLKKDVGAMKEGASSMKDTLNTLSEDISNIKNLIIVCASILILIVVVIVVIVVLVWFVIRKTTWYDNLKRKHGSKKNGVADPATEGLLKRDSSQCDISINDINPIAETDHITNEMVADPATEGLLKRDSSQCDISINDINPIAETDHITNEIQLHTCSITMSSYNTRKTEHGSSANPNALLVPSATGDSDRNENSPSVNDNEG